MTVTSRDARPEDVAPDGGDAAADGDAAVRARRDDRRVRRLVGLGWPVLQALARTWRIRVVDREPLDALRAQQQPLVLSCWHGDLLPLVWQHRDEGVHALISEHRDGELIARVVERLGFQTVRGSTTRGAGRALLALSRLIQHGADIAVTPDGPRGPAHRYAAGALVAAQRAGAPIIPIGIAVSRAWRTRGWDRFVVPKPFATISVAYGPPTWVQAADARGAAAEAGRFEEIHAAASARAAEAANAR